MSRAIASILIISALISGCVAQPPVDTSSQYAASVVAPPPVGEWFDQLDAVDAMDSSEVVTQLEKVDKTAGANQLFYYGALKQKLPDYGAWTVARDAFQNLQDNQTLTREQRQLAGILREYNQNRINGYSRYNKLLNERIDLQEGLSQAEDEKRQLEQKIQALTELETAISTRQEE